MKGFARREFQLVLLRRMADYQPDLVTEAARSLDASRTEMREVNARWQRMVRSRSFPNARARLAAVLGPPIEPLACHVHHPRRRRRRLRSPLRMGPTPDGGQRVSRARRPYVAGGTLLRSLLDMTAPRPPGASRRPGVRGATQPV